MSLKSHALNLKVLPAYLRREAIEAPRLEARQRPELPKPPQKVVELARSNHAFVEELQQHPDLASYRNTSNNILALLPSEEELFERSRLYASSAVRRALRNGILPARLTEPTHRADLDKMVIKTLTIRGQNHFCKQTECQDSVVYAHEGSFFVGVVCDGAGAFDLSHYGSKLLAHETLATVREVLQEVPGRLFPIISPEILAKIYSRLYRRIAHILHELGITPGDAYKTFLAATLQILIITSEETLVLALGDGFVKWYNALYGIEASTHRARILQDANHPPLLICGLAFDSGADPIRSCDDEIRTALHEEAKSFDIVAYAHTYEVLNDSILLSSDGLRFAEDVLGPSDGSQHFPMERIVSRYSEELAQTIANLFNFVCDSARGEAKLDLLREVMQARCLSVLPAFADFKTAVSRKIRESLEQHAKLDSASVQRVCSKPIDAQIEFLCSDVKGRSNEMFVAASFLERGAISDAAAFLSEAFHLKAGSGSQALWDDVGLIYVAKNKPPVPMW